MTEKLLQRIDALRNERNYQTGIPILQWDPKLNQYKSIGTYYLHPECNHIDGHTYLTLNPNVKSPEVANYDLVKNNHVLSGPMYDLG